MYEIVRRHLCFAYAHVLLWTESDNEITLFLLNDVSQFDFFAVESVITSIVFGDDC
jgi:hypothetical protein